jgi:hypothetical protein
MNRYSAVSLSCSGLTDCHSFAPDLVVADGDNSGGPYRTPDCRATGSDPVVAPSAFHHGGPGGPRWATEDHDRRTTFFNRLDRYSAPRTLIMHAAATQKTPWPTVVLGELSVEKAGDAALPGVERTCRRDATLWAKRTVVGLARAHALDAIGKPSMCGGARDARSGPGPDARGYPHV